MQSYQNTAYAFGLSPLVTMAPYPINAQRAPTSSDINYPLGQEWIYAATNSIYFLASVVANVATWINVGGGAGSFTTLTVTGQSTLGPLTVVGTTLINTTGTAATTIGNSTAGVGLVGPSTVTGTFGASGITTVASGVTPAVAGSILEVLGGGGAAPSIVVSAGVPSVTAGINKGSLAINNTATTASTRLYIFDGTAWQAFTAAG